MTKYLEKSYQSFKRLSGIKEGGISDGETTDDEIDYESDTDIVGQMTKMNEEKATDDQEQEITEELSLEELENLYSTENDLDLVIENEKDSKKTSNLIEQILEQDKDWDKIEKLNDLITFDTSKDNLNFDESLKNVFNKQYVFNNYIYKDDTIKNIKNKIICSIKKSKSC